MKGYISNLIIDNKQCSLYLPPQYFISNKKYPVVYVNGDEIDKDLIDVIEPHFNSQCVEFIMLGVKSENWNDDFTPWEGRALTKKSEPFKGEALKFIKCIENNIKPFIDSKYKVKGDPFNTVLIGYSLAGLASLYALYISEVFGKMGILSGSLWYDGWIEFMENNAPINNLSKVYMSLGKKEEHSRNQRMAKVGQCTREAEIILQRQLLLENVVLEWNEGGHFNQINDRFKKALLWLMKQN